MAASQRRQIGPGPLEGPVDFKLPAAAVFTTAVFAFVRNLPYLDDLNLAFRHRRIRTAVSSCLPRVPDFSEPGQASVFWGVTNDNMPTVFLQRLGTDIADLAHPPGNRQHSFAAGVMVSNVVENGHRLENVAARVDLAWCLQKTLSLSVRVYQQTRESADRALTHTLTAGQFWAIKEDRLGSSIFQRRWTELLSQRVSQLEHDNAGSGAYIAELLERPVE